MSAEKRYYWLKLPEGFFHLKEVKKIRRLAGGDTCLIIYLKLLLRSLENGGKLFFDGIEETFAAEMALDLDESLENVTVTFNLLAKMGILQPCGDNEYELLTAEQMTGMETDTTRRVRAHRARKALQNSEQMLLRNTDVTERNADVADCNTEIEIEKDIELEKELEREVEGADEALARSSDVQRVVDAWNTLGLQTVKKVAPGTDRDAWLRKRIRDYGIDNVLDAIEKVRASSFLMGDNRSGWQITFDWFLRPNNFPKVLDGNYDNRDRQENGSTPMDDLRSLHAMYEGDG